MALSNGLKVQTINYMDLIGLGKTFSLPPYQCDYSWSEQHWENLWNDIIRMTEDTPDRHFMGTLFIQEKKDREFVVIDGQQRLTSLNIFGLAVISKLNQLADQGMDPSSNMERARRLQNRFVGEKDPAALTESTRLRLNHTDNSFYLNYLVQQRTPPSLRKFPWSNQLLWECFQYFSAKLDELKEHSEIGHEVASLLSQTVARKLYFICITVEDELDAYTLFETINARGLQLTVTDLLKNYLFSLVRVPTDIAVLQVQWESLLNFTDYERFPDFLRYHLLCTHEHVSRQHLFKMVKNETRSSGGVFTLMTELDQRADLFAAMSDPNHDHWSELPGAKPYIRELSLFHIDQMMPLIFATWEFFSPEDFARVLKLLSVITFRYSIICKLNPNLPDRVYPHAAKEVLSQPARTPSDVFTLIKSIYVDDEIMIQNFSTFALNPRGRNKKIVKYILSTLEQDASGRACDFETDHGTIEHILPENPVEQWDETFPLKYQGRSVFRLGNLALLESSINRDIGNSTYDQKSVAYRESSYALTREVPEIAPEEWNLALLDKRQREFALKSTRLWRSDFA